MNPEEVQKMIDEALQEQQEELAFYRKYLSDRIVFSRDLKINDGRNIQTGRINGTKIATETDQKLAFYGTTPVDQPDTVQDPEGGVTVDGSARTAINSILDRLIELGLIAPQA